MLIIFSIYFRLYFKETSFLKQVKIANQKILVNLTKIFNRPLVVLAAQCLILRCWLWKVKSKNHRGPKTQSLAGTKIKALTVFVSVLLHVQLMDLIGMITTISKIKFNFVLDGRFYRHKLLPIPGWLWPTFKTAYIWYSSVKVSWLYFVLCDSLSHRF